MVSILTPIFSNLLCTGNCCDAVSSLERRLVITLLFCFLLGALTLPWFWILCPPTLHRMTVLGRVPRLFTKEHLIVLGLAEWSGWFEQLAIWASTSVSRDYFHEIGPKIGRIGLFGAWHPHGSPEVFGVRVGKHGGHDVPEGGDIQGKDM